VIIWPQKSLDDMTDDPEFSGVEIVTTFVFIVLLAWF
jgi:hypothetical protein